VGRLGVASAAGSTDSASKGWSLQISRRRAVVAGCAGRRRFGGGLDRTATVEVGGTWVVEDFHLDDGTHALGAQRSYSKGQEAPSRRIAIHASGVEPGGPTNRRPMPSRPSRPS
jgi:hypothetical protein